MPTVSGRITWAAMVMNPVPEPCCRTCRHWRQTSYTTMVGRCGLVQAYLVIDGDAATVRKALGIYRSRHATVGLWSDALTAHDMSCRNGYEPNR